MGTGISIISSSTFSLFPNQMPDLSGSIINWLNFNFPSNNKQEGRMGKQHVEWRKEQKFRAARERVEYRTTTGERWNPHAFCCRRRTLGRFARTPENLFRLNQLLLCSGRDSRCRASNKFHCFHSCTSVVGASKCKLQIVFNVQLLSATILSDINKFNITVGPLQFCTPTIQCKHSEREIRICDGPKLNPRSLSFHIFSHSLSCGLWQSRGVD